MPKEADGTAIKLPKPITNKGSYIDKTAFVKK
jgi:hypothetical protein